MHGSKQEGLVGGFRHISAFVFLTRFSISPSHRSLSLLLLSLSLSYSRAWTMRGNHIAQCQRELN